MARLAFVGDGMGGTLNGLVETSGVGGEVTEEGWWREEEVVMLGTLFVVAFCYTR